MVAQQDITGIWQIGAPLCQSCGHELTQDEIGTVCDLCIAEEVAGRYYSRDKSAVYWYWLDMVDTMEAKPGEPTKLERNVTTGHAIRWAERYEADRRKLNELYEWFGIERDTPVAQVTGEPSGIALASL